MLDGKMFRAPTGTPIKAPNAGRVVLAFLGQQALESLDAQSRIGRQLGVDVVRMR